MNRRWLAGAACLFLLLVSGPVLGERVPFGVTFPDRGYRRIGAGDGVIVYQRLNLPLVSDCNFTLRVTRNKGTWLVGPTDAGRSSRVRLTISTDLGGQVPMWMVRPSFAKELPRLGE